MAIASGSTSWPTRRWWITRPRPRTLVVFGRERLALRGLYASGGVGFLDEAEQEGSFLFFGNGGAVGAGAFGAHVDDVGAVGNAEWTGVSLGELLQQAGIKASAVEVILEGADEGAA